MARIKITDTQFPDIIMAYLLDMMIHDDEPTGNEDFDQFLAMMDSKGMFPRLLSYFRSMQPENRRRYKLIKKGISPHDQTTEQATIQVLPDPAAKEE